MEPLALFIFVLVLAAVIKNSQGRLGEIKTEFTMWVSLDSKIYHSVHDVIVPSKNGTTQIDHLLVSPFGVFIIETKNMKGWIFGSAKQEKWVQSLYRKKFTFQNPLRQTYRQKRVLSGYLNLSEASIHTVIYFVGNCTFKTQLPSNVIQGGLETHIKQFQKHILSSEEVSRIIRQLDALRFDPSLTARNHVKSLYERHNSSTTCPKCGSSLIQRTAKQGRNAGGKFLGCSNYPKCKFTKKIS